jgi:hypothetical protein
MNYLIRRSEMVRKTTHVVPSHNGGWDVKRSQNQRASGHFETKKEAIYFGRNLSQKHNSEFFIHNQNGKIARKDSHGGDPYPPRG